MAKNEAMGQEGMAGDYKYLMATMLRALMRRVARKVTYATKKKERQNGRGGAKSRKS